MKNRCKTIVAPLTDSNDEYKNTPFVPAFDLLEKTSNGGLTDDEVAAVALALHLQLPNGDTPHQVQSPWKINALLSGISRRL